jgi:hypothetical protein
MANWKKTRGITPLPRHQSRSIPPRQFIPRRWAYNPTAEEMEKLLDAVFYYVIGRVPVTKYEEDA